jgi:hypothetical protein
MPSINYFTQARVVTSKEPSIFIGLHEEASIHENIQLVSLVGLESMAKSIDLISNHDRSALAAHPFCM